MGEYLGGHLAKQHLADRVNADTVGTHIRSDTSL